MDSLMNTLVEVGRCAWSSISYSLELCSTDTDATEKTFRPEELSVPLARAIVRIYEVGLAVTVNVCIRVRPGFEFLSIFESGIGRKRDV